MRVLGKVTLALVVAVPVLQALMGPELNSSFRYGVNEADPPKEEIAIR
jgi:hypothetical protein